MKEAFSSGETATIYTDSTNNVIPLGSFTTSDVGKRGFLSTSAGGLVVTPPVASGNLVQPLGYISSVATYVVLDFEPGLEIIA